MHVGKITAAMIPIAIATMFLAPSAANAQFGFYSLPKDDFVWNWGRDFETRSRAFEDFSVRGGEAGFNCELTGKLSPASRLSPSDVRALENELQMRMDFVYAASQYMNQLDQTREIDWATLDCKRHEAGPVDEEKRAERENQAREKMQRELDRRRERAARDAANSR